MKEILESVGLTKGEIKVYFTLLKLGTTTTGDIIKEAQLSSGKIYQILDKLMKKGLASYIMKNKTKYFMAASPHRILDFLHEKEEELHKKEEEIKNLIPELIAEQKELEYNAVLYQGLRGFKTAIYEALDSITAKDTILAMGVTAQKREVYNRTWKAWNIARIKKKIPAKIIFSERGTDFYKHYKNLRYTTVKHTTLLTPAALDVFGDKITLIFTYGKNPSCLMITSKEIAQSFIEFFNTLWKIAKS